eukprot:7381804-Prymnesium_polylepis.3
MRRYLRNGLVIDMLGTAPFQIIFVSTALLDQRFAHALKFISLVRIVKVFRLARMDPHITRARGRMGAAEQQVVLLIVGLMWFFHLLGCLYWLIVRAELGSFSPRELMIEFSESDWIPPHSFITLAGNSLENRTRAEVWHLVNTAGRSPRQFR